MSPVESSNDSVTRDNLDDLNQSSTLSLSPSPFQNLPTSHDLLPLIIQTPMSTAASADYDYPFVGQPIPTDKIILGSFLFVVVGVTFAANLLVLASFVVEKKLRTTFTALIANLALADLLLSVMSMDFYTIAIVVYQYWPMGKIMCGIWIVVDRTLVMASCYTLAAIAADRMWSIKWSISYREYNGTKKAACFIVAIWAFSMAVVVYPLTVDRIKHTRLYDCSLVPSQNPVFMLVWAVVGHHMPTVIILVCTIVVFVERKKLARTRPRAATSGLQQSTTEVTQVEESTQGGGEEVSRWRGWMRGKAGGTTTSLKLGTTPKNEAGAGSQKVENKMSPVTVASASSGTDPKPTTSKADTAEQARMETVSSAPAPGITQHHPSAQPLTAADLNVSGATRVHNHVPTGGTENDRKDAQKTDAAKTPAVGGEQGGKAGPSDDVRMRRTLVTLTYIMTCYVICWVPFGILFDLALVNPSVGDSNAYTYTFWMSYVNSTVNPFLYAFSSREIRATIWKIVTCKKFNRRN